MVMEVPEATCPQNRTWHHQVPLTLQCLQTGWRLWAVHLLSTTSGEQMWRAEALVYWRHTKAEDAGCPAQRDTQGNLQKLSRENSPWRVQTSRDLLSPRVSHRSDCQRVEAREMYTEKLHAMLQACSREEHWLTTVWKKSHLGFLPSSPAS